MRGWETDPEELAAAARAYNDPWSAEAFLTPLESALIDLYKARPFRMRAFMKEFRWVQKEVRKRGVTEL